MKIELTQSINDALPKGAVLTTVPNGKIAVDVAKQLIAQGRAKEVEAQPLEGLSEDELRDIYLELKGDDADGRWSEKRLIKEIKALQ